MIKYFSAFAGIGGFDLAIARTIPDAECIGISEVDKHAIKIYEKHFPDRTNFGDIRKIKTKDLPDFDLFCGGFPCQDVSIAGKRAGLCGARSGLFFEIIRIVRKKQPRIVFLENVKGLLSSNKGWDFARILAELDGAGYSTEWAVYNSKNFGVPQKRERVFIIGHSGREPGTKIFPLGEYGQIPNGQTREEGVQQNACCLSGRHYANWNGNYVAKCLTGGGNSGGLHSSMTCISSQPRCGDPAKGGTGLLISEDSSFTLNKNPHLICDSGLSRKKQVRTDVTPPLRANTGAGHNNIVNSIRRLTPIECERLQGFPEKWTAFGSDDKPISDTQRYKCLGNAVTVPVIEAIMTAIRETWGLK